MAATDSSAEVLKAVVATLKAHAGLTALVGARIYNRAPQSVTFPHVRAYVIAAAPAVEIDASEGFEVVLGLDAWSRSAAGQEEVLPILAAMTDALNNALPALDSKTVVMMRHSGGTVRELPDNLTTHGFIRLTVVTDG